MDNCSFVACEPNMGKWPLDKTTIAKQGLTNNVLKLPSHISKIQKTRDGVRRIWFNWKGHIIRLPGSSRNKEPLSDSKNLGVHNWLRINLFSKMKNNRAIMIPENSTNPAPSRWKWVVNIDLDTMDVWLRPRYIWSNPAQLRSQDHTCWKTINITNWRNITFLGKSGPPRKMVSNV